MHPSALCKKSWLFEAAMHRTAKTSGYPQQLTGCAGGSEHGQAWERNMIARSGRASTCPKNGNRRLRDIRSPPPDSDQPLRFRSKLK